MAERRNGKNLETHFLTILSILTASGVGWIGTTVVELKEKVAALGDKYALREDLNSVVVEVKEMRSRQDKRTTTVEAMEKYLKDRGMK